MVATTYQPIVDSIDTDHTATGSEDAERACPSHILPLTHHARKRSARRNIAPDAVEYVMAYGRRIQRTGVTFFFLGRRDIPRADRRASWASRLEGTIVVLAPDEDVITIYRNRRGLHAIQRKMKYRIANLGWPIEVACATHHDMLTLATA